MDTSQKKLIIADILVLPSFREGFGLVIMEAAAMGIPAIGSKIYGLSDSIIHGETGLLVTPKDSGELAKALHKFVYDTELCSKFGQSAQKRALEYFSSNIINKKIIREYERLLRKKGISCDSE